MAEEQKDATKEFQSFCKRNPFAEMMGKMMAAKKARGSFDCAEMISQMMGMCCGAGRKEEEANSRSQKE